MKDHRSEDRCLKPDDIYWFQSDNDVVHLQAQLRLRCERHDPGGRD